MKRLLCLLVIGCVGLPFEAPCLEWLTDAQAAQDKARQENKFVLLDFTGSDWCGWCMKLKAEVFDQPQFRDFVEDKFVLVTVDFPHRWVLSEEQQKANRELAGKYNVTGYPTIVVLGPNGQFAGRTGYLRGGPQAFNAKLEEIQKRFSGHPAAVTRAEPEPPRKPVIWTPPPQVTPVHDGSLTLKGICGTKERRMVLINNADLMVGDVARVKVEDRDVEVCCKEIREDSVLITVDGKPMELKLSGR